MNTTYSSVITAAAIDNYNNVTTGTSDNSLDYSTETAVSNDLPTATDLTTKLVMKSIDDSAEFNSLIKKEEFSTIPLMLTDPQKVFKSKSLKSGNKKSFVWKYFTHPKNADGIEDRSRTECIECKSQLAFNASGTTTTMLNHLKSRHPKIAEGEEWRKHRSPSLNVSKIENNISINSVSKNDSPDSVSSFDLSKQLNQSPDYKSPPELSFWPLMTNNSENYLDQGRLLCLTKLLPQQFIVNSTCSAQPSTESNNIIYTTNSGQISLYQGKVNSTGDGNNNFTSVDTNSNNGTTCSSFSMNRSAVKRKRKKPICIQNSNQSNLNLTQNQTYRTQKQIKSEPQKSDSQTSDLASIQSINALSQNSSTSINNILYSNFLSTECNNGIYNDNNNNNSSPSYFMRQSPYSVFNRSSSPTNSFSKSVTESERILAYWLIKDLRPYSTLEETGIKTLFATLMPNIPLPTVLNLKTHIVPSIYSSLKSAILNDFALESGSAFSIELWENQNSGCMYASIKLHFYSVADSKLKCKMLKTKEINVKQLCSDLLISGCAEIGIDLCTVHFLPVVMNNSESMKDELANVGEIEQNKKFMIIPCLINSLQEVAKFGFEESEVVKLLEKCRELKDLAKAYNLQLDVPINSSHNPFKNSKYSNEKFELLCWICAHHDQIMDKIDCMNTDRFNKDDETFLKQLMPLLEHIYQTLNVIEQDKLFFSASMIKSIILTMNKSPFQPKDDEHPGVIQFKIAVKKRLNKIYPSSGPLHELLWIATLLDPRFKKCHEHFTQEEALMVQSIRNQIKTTNDVTTDILEETQSAVRREDLQFIFGEDFLSYEPKSEVDQYLTEHKIDIEKNPIKWWQDNCARFPNLSKVALKYLCIPLSNQGGHSCLENDSVMLSRRKEIDPEDIDNYLFLNHNWI